MSFFDWFLFLLFTTQFLVLLYLYDQLLLFNFPHAYIFIHPEACVVCFHLLRVDSLGHLTTQWSHLLCPVVAGWKSSLWPKLRGVQGQHRCECGKAYMQKGNLKRHKNYECGQTPRFTCTVCARKFKFKFDAQKHVAGVHKMENFDEYVEGR